MFENMYKTRKRESQPAQTVKNNSPNTFAPRRYIQVDPSQKHLVTHPDKPFELKAGYIVTMPDGTEVKLGR